MELIYPQFQPALGKKRFGIGIVGAGSIIQVAHLPAYRKAGFSVIGLYDPNQEKAQAVAAEFGIGVFTTLEEMLGDERIEIVDIAVPPWVQAGIVEQVARAGKHILCQKPIALTYEEAAEIVRFGEQAGIKLAVNHQMRWDPLIASAKDLIERGWIGKPLTVNIQVSIMTPWETWPWLAQSPQLDLMYHSIHYFDSVRHLIGMPDYVYCSIAKKPGDATRAETRSMTIYEYVDEKRALIAVNHGNTFDDTYAELRIEGTEGVIKGTFGLLYDYPRGRPDTLEYCSDKFYPGQWFRQRIEELWIPDAFVGTMGELQLAVEEDREPSNSGRDVLETIQLVLAGYRSAEQKRAIRPAEIGAV